MANYLQMQKGGARSAAAEALHDLRLCEFAAVSQKGYDQLASEMVRVREDKVFSPADRSTLHGVNADRPVMEGLIPRKGSMPPHDASDLIFLVTDRCWQRNEPAPNSAREGLYRTIVTKVLAACEKAGLPVPENNPVIGVAIERAGMDPTKVKMVDLEDPRSAFATSGLRERLPDFCPLPPRKDLGLIERGGRTAVYRELIKETDLMER